MVRKLCLAILRGDSLFGRTLILVVLIILISACGSTATPVPPTATEVSPSPARVPPTVASTSVQPTATPVPPTDAPVPRAETATPTPTETATPLPTATPATLDDLKLDVPAGDPPTIDGTLSSDEWTGARVVSLTDGELLFMHDGAYLYLGIRSDIPGLGSICVDQGDKVAVLHSSASLGTAVYEQSGKDWVRTRDFTWTRSYGSHLQREGWLASDANMGVAGEMEYQISMPEGMMRLAVMYLKEPAFTSATVWPAHLADDCRKIELLQGYAPVRMQLSPETWMTVTASPTSELVTPPTPLPTLSGSGGGVIAYCYQPMTGSSLHQIYAINADGSDNRKLIEAPIGLNHHDWSPDAQRIAAVGYVGQSTWSIYVFDVDGGDLTRLTDTFGVWDSEPSWSPDGASIAFTRIYPEQDFREEIWVMNADGSDQHWIGVEGFAAKWSPGGSRFIYTSDHSGNYEIYTSNIDGTDEQKLTNTSADESFPIWSPDGSQVAYSASTGEWNTRDNTKTYEIYVMDANGTNVRQLTDNAAYDSYPRWSPDGSLIVFSSDRAETEHWEVYVMNADGSDVRRVTNTPSSATAINPVWRP